MTLTEIALTKRRKISNAKQATLGNRKEYDDEEKNDID